MEAKFVQLGEMKVVGTGTKFISIMSVDKNSMQQIPQLWSRFMGRIGEIENRANEFSIGMVEMLPREGRSHRDEMFYVAGAQVLEFGVVPQGMIKRVIPAGRYALFTHKGTLVGLEKTMKFIYESWLPKSGVQMRDGPHLEMYDQRFIPDSDKSEYDILVPVK